MRKPWCDAKRPKKVVDFLFIEVDIQIVWPIAGALFVARRRPGHLVVIAVRLDEISCARFVGCQSRVARKLQRAGHFDENILQTSGKADNAVGLALACDDGLRPI